MKKENEQLYNDPWERDWYETGSTRPPKDRGGLIATLLMLVIVLGSIATALGVMNIRLFRLLTAEQQAGTVYLSPASADSTTATGAAGIQPGDDAIVRLGMEGQTVSGFDRRFYHLPQGYLVTRVEKNCCAHRAGIRTGDVIVAVEDQPIVSGDELAAAIHNCQPGQKLCLRIYRQQVDKELSVTIQIGGDTQ